MELLIYTDIQEILADKIYQVRKKQKISQKDISLRAGIPLSTYQRIEQTGEGSMKNFAKILIALNRADEINKILNVSSDTPIEVYERKRNG